MRRIKSSVLAFMLALATHQAVADHGPSDQMSPEYAAAMQDSSMLESSCCEDACQTCGGHIVGGAGVLFVQPFFEGNPAATVLRSSPPAGIQQNSNQQVDFQYHAEASPFLWLGYVNADGLGIRGRYWEFEHQSDTVTLGNAEGAVANAFGIPALGPGPGTTIFSAYPLGQGNTTTTAGALVTYDSDIDLNTIDLEITQEMEKGRWKALFSGGVRYARIEQHYTSVEVRPTALSGSLLQSQHDFEGAGPVIAAELRRRIGDSGLSLYGNTRGALLYGNGGQTVTDQEFVGGVMTISELNQVEQDDLLPIAEIELGVDFSRQARHATWFLQTAVVAQSWFGAGNAANSGPIALGPQAQNIGTVPDEAADNTSNLGFVGLKITAGVDF